jgi:hypothetical protein
LKDVQSKLTGDALAYIQDLCSSEPSGKALRFVLHLALLVSPLCLCLPISLHKKPFSRKCLMELSSVLGPNKPDILRRVEKLLWTVVFDIVERPQDVATILKGVDDLLPWSDVLALSDQKDLVATWFDVETQCEFPLPGPTLTPVSPSSSVSQNSHVSEPGPKVVQGETPLLVAPQPEEPTKDIGVNDGTFSQISDTEGSKELEMRTGTNVKEKMAQPGTGTDGNEGGCMSVIDERDKDEVEGGHSGKNIEKDESMDTDESKAEESANNVENEEPMNQDEGVDGDEVQARDDGKGEGGCMDEDEDEGENEDEDEGEDEDEDEGEDEDEDEGVDGNEVQARDDSKGEGGRMDEDKDQGDDNSNEDECIGEDTAYTGGSLQTQAMTKPQRSLRERKPGPVLKSETSSNKGLSSNQRRKKTKGGKQNSLSKRGEKVVKTSLEIKVYIL